MEYVTVENLENMISICRTFFVVLLALLGSWSILSTILTILKVYLFRDNKKELIKYCFDLIKYISLVIIIGYFTHISSLVYNGGYSILNMIFSLIVIVPTIISVIILIIYKKIEKEEYSCGQ